MYPGNHTESDMLYVPRYLKTRPGAPQTHLAYITPDEEKILQQYKPGTPHRGPAEIPNYDTWGWDGSSGSSVTGGSTADTGGSWSGDVSYGNQGNQNNQNNQNDQGNIHQDETIIPTDTVINNDVTNTVETPTSEWDKIWNLATQAYESNPGYAKSYEGKEFAKRLEASGITEGSPEYQKAMVEAFGLPQIISTTSHYRDKDGKIVGLGDITKTTPEYDNEGNLIFGDKFIYSGQGQHLMDQYDDPTGNYQEQVDDYYKMREEEMAQQTGNNYGYGYSYPSYSTVSGGHAYGHGDPSNIGKTPWDYGDPYSEARYASDPMMKFMVDAHSPMYAARGGIMNLRR